MVLLSDVTVQAPLNWSVPEVINSGPGTDWPRVAIANGTPIAVWGDFLSGNIYVRTLNNGNFGPQIKLTPAGVAATVFSLTGPDLKAAGDTVYVTYVNADGNHAYLHRLFDHGLTFSDTIRIDNIGNNFVQYSSLAIMPGGNPIIAFAQLTPNFSNPQYVFTKSADGGSSFSAAIPVTEPLGGDPCDCCPGSIAYKNGIVAVIYRNAVNNLRDMRAAISLDGGNTFSIGNIDNNNWIIANCPSSGGEGIIHHDSLISVFMNGVNNNKCFVSSLNMNNLALNYENPLFSPPGDPSQNHPRICASNDTMAAVWEQTVAGHRNIMFSYSLTGPAALGEVVDTISNVITNGFHSSPDIAYGTGKFYVVFADELQEQIYMMVGKLYEINGVQPVASIKDPLLQFTSISQGIAINILSSKLINQPCEITVYDSNGAVCSQQQLPMLATKQAMFFGHRLTNGIYLVRVANKDFQVSGKFAVAY